MVLEAQPVLASRKQVVMVGDGGVGPGVPWEVLPRDMLWAGLSLVLPMSLPQLNAGEPGIQACHMFLL